MKKILSLILTLTLTIVVLFSCAPEEVNEVSSLRVGFLKGPTGIGMAKLINDNGGLAGNEKYTFTNYENNTSKAMIDFLDGAVDIVCLPTREAAINYNTTDDESMVLALNTLNTLYVVAKGSDGVSAAPLKSISDLEGKTVYTCEAGTPKVIIESLLSKAKVNATVSTKVNGATIGTPDILKTQIEIGAVDLAVVPEPILTASLLLNPEYSIVLDLSDEWKDNFTYECPMGCIVANKNFVNKNKNLIKSFLEEYEASIEFISNADNIADSAKFVVNAGIMDKEPPAKKAILNLGDQIAYVDGTEMQKALIAFYNAIGVDQPENTFYYNAK